MPLITKPPTPLVKEKFKLRMTKEIMEEMDAYCQWQAIDRDYFMEQAALQIFKKDKEWQEYKSVAQPLSHANQG